MPEPSGRSKRAESARLTPHGRTIARLARQVTTGVSDCGLSLAQYRVLDFLSNEDAAAAASRLADRLSVSRPTITSLVDGLVAKGLVARRPADDDRRRVVHTLTAKGRRVLDEADRAVDAVLEPLRDQIEPQDRDAADAGLSLWGLALDAARLAMLESAEAGE